MSHALHVIALVIWGNAYLANASTISPSDLTGSSGHLAEFSVSFSKNDAILNDALAHNILEWFDFLKAEECTALIAHYVKPTKPAPNEGWWHSALDNSYLIIETQHPGGSRYWAADWEFDRKASSWNITYSNVKTPHTNLLAEEKDVDEATDILRDIIIASRDFAATNIPSLGWQKLFSESVSAFSVQNDETIEMLFGSQSIAGLDESPRSLLRAAKRTTHFGGMGAWDDGVGDFDDAQEEEYHRLLAELYFELHRAFVAVANSTANRSRAK